MIMEPMLKDYSNIDWGGCKEDLK